MLVGLVCGLLLVHIGNCEDQQEVARNSANATTSRHANVYRYPGYEYIKYYGHYDKFRPSTGSGGQVAHRPGGFYFNHRYPPPFVNQHYPIINQQWPPTVVRHPYPIINQQYPPTMSHQFPVGNQQWPNVNHQFPTMNQQWPPVNRY